MGKRGNQQRKRFAVSQIVSQTEQQVRPSQWNGWCEMQQAQGQELVDRAEPEMSDSLPSRSLVVQGGSTRPGVAVGESHSENPCQGGPADEEIVSVVCLQGQVIELSSSMKKRLVKILLDSGAIGNFILDAMATALKLQVQDDKDFFELTLDDGTIMPTTGYVQFVMN